MASTSSYHHAKFVEDCTTRAGCMCENVVFVCFFLYFFLHATRPACRSFEGCIVPTSIALPFIGRFRRGFQPFYRMDSPFRCTRYFSFLSLGMMMSCNYVCVNVKLQLIDMTPGQVEWLASHLGHEIGTHKRNYRLHPKEIEVTKVGRILCAMDSGSSVAGKRMSTLIEGMYRCGFQGSVHSAVTVELLLYAVCLFLLISEISIFYFVKSQSDISLLTKKAVYVQRHLSVHCITVDADQKLTILLMKPLRDVAESLLATHKNNGFHRFPSVVLANILYATAKCHP